MCRWRDLGRFRKAKSCREEVTRPLGMPAAPGPEGWAAHHLCDGCVGVLSG